MRRQSQLFLQGLLAAALYAAVALVYLRPIWAVYADHIAPNAADPLFVLYTLKWGIHQARLGFPDLWNANVFYPTKGALAFSDHLLGPALAISCFKNAIAGYNVLFFSSFVLTGLATWWMLADDPAGLRSFPAALLGGAMYAFSPYRMSQVNHLAILVAQWLPLTLWSFDRLLAERTGRRAALFLLFYGLNLTVGCYFAYMIHVPLLAILLSRGLALRRELGTAWWPWRAWKVLLPVAVLALAGTLALFLPYLRFSHDRGLTRDPREVAGNAAAFASYLSPAPESLYSMYSLRELWDRSRLPRWRQPFARAENALFPGFLATLFAAWGAAAFWRRYRLPPERPIRGGRRLLLWALLALALLAYALGDVFTLKLDINSPLSPWLSWASGPVWIALGAVFLGSLALWAVLHRRFSGTGLLDWRAMDPWQRGLVWSGALAFLLAHSIIYIPLMKVVPGMDGMRVPARFVVFFGLTLVDFAARGVDGFLARFRRPAGRALALAGLGALLFVELLPRPLNWVEILREEDFPEVYHWLAGRADVRALLEIPMKASWRETAYMYYSTLHWKPIANGYSGYLPPSYEQLSDQLGRGFPDLETLDLLARMGITHVVVHPLELGGEWRRAQDPMGLVRQWEEEVDGRIELVKDADPDRVYRIVPRRSPP
jgi:hypothetical protein